MMRMTTSDLQILEYCEPHIHQMWAATIVSFIFNCDFRDAPERLKQFRNGR